MEKTVLITGSSSGFGLYTAKLFQTKGWNVAATMRIPSNAPDLAALSGVKVYPLDVTKPTLIDETIQQIIRDFGSIDVLVNNAGFAATGALEAASEDVVRKQLGTNVVGVINVMQAVLPQMRKQRSGVIVNISSVAGRIAIPFNSLYNASKFAVEGLTESLQYELNPFGIRLKLIEPAGYQTEFAGRSMLNVGAGDIEDYKKAFELFYHHMNGQFSENIHEVAEAIYASATDDSFQLRYPVGKAAFNFLELRKTQDDVAFKNIIAGNTGL